MGLFGKFGRWLREHLPIGEPSPVPPREEPPTHTAPPEHFPPHTGERQPTPFTSELPPGWVLVGLYHQGEKTTRIHATDATQVTDRDIANADALVVQFLPDGENGYRWIHGAPNWRKLADQIEKVTKVVSPTTGE